MISSCHTSLYFSFPTSTRAQFLCHCNFRNTNHNEAAKNLSSFEFVQKILLRSFAGFLSLALISSNYSPLLAADSVLSLADLCKEEADSAEEVSSASVTNEDIVEEAWEVVNESFIGRGGRRAWSPEMWLQEKEYIFQNKIQTRSRAHNVIQKMLASLGDPYTRFLSPAEFSKMAKYDVTGIGINLREVPDENGLAKIKVLGVILDGPAHSSGVKQGDELLSVNGLDIKGKSAFDVSSMLQGPKETFVTIEVRHGDCGPTHSIKVQRKNVTRTPIFYRLEKMGKENVPVGYVRIKEFNALARKDLIVALKNLLNSGASYLVLDLRDNLGGLVQMELQNTPFVVNLSHVSNIRFANAVISAGDVGATIQFGSINFPVIYTAGRDAEVQKTISAETSPFCSRPIIVLVNNRTASASEIVASALHDNCKAVLVGEKTYGKGLIQSVYELHDGSGMVVTIGKYVTPNHMDINGNGIEPDFSSFPALNEVSNYLSRCQMQRV